VAYYRHSAQDRQENSIPIQQDQVRQFAREQGIEIIEEFADAGKSGLNAEDRPAFTEMMDDWVKQKHDFDYVLCLDVSRWGRFQDIDLSAQYSAECKRHGKQVFDALYNIWRVKFVPRLPADIRISLKKRGGPTHLVFGVLGPRGEPPPCRSEEASITWYFRRFQEAGGGLTGLRAK